MQTRDAIHARHSVRAFLPKPVSKEVLLPVLEAARWAPSACNRQPWRVTAVTGPILDEIRERLVAQARARQAAVPNLSGEPPEVAANYACVQASFSQAAEAMGISLWDFVITGSYSFFGAPAVLVISTLGGRAAGVEEASRFISTLLLAAQDQGLGSCWLGYPLSYPEIIREALGIPEEQRLSGAVALGYPDPDSPANGFRAERMPLDDLVRWVGFD